MPAGSSLAVSGDDSHGELGPSGLGELGGGGLEELDLGTAMGELNPGRQQLPASRLAAATAMASSAPAAWASSTLARTWGSSTPAAWGSTRSAAATVLAVGEWLWSSAPSGGPCVET